MTVTFFNDDVFFGTSRLHTATASGDAFDFIYRVHTFYDFLQRRSSWPADFRRRSSGDRCLPR